MKNKLIIVLLLALICLLGASSYYIYTLRLQNDQNKSIIKLSNAAKCPACSPCEKSREEARQPEISPVSKEYEALYCGASGREMTGDYYLYYGAESDFKPEKKLSLGKLKFDAAQKDLFEVYLNGQTHYVGVAQYESCNFDIYRVWNIRKDDSFIPVTFDYGQEGRSSSQEIAVSFSGISLGSDKIQVYTYWGASPGDIADRTYYFRLYQDSAMVEKIITNYGEGLTGYEYYIDMEDPGPSAEKPYYLYSFKLPSAMNLSFQLRQMLPQYQMMLDNYMIFELAVGNKITYDSFANDPFKQAEIDGVNFYFYLYSMKYDWHKIFLDSFTIDGVKVFKD
jgi:hypothetical protein